MAFRVLSTIVQQAGGRNCSLWKPVLFQSTSSHLTGASSPLSYNVRVMSSSSQSPRSPSVVAAIPEDLRVGVVGYGKMATALMTGFIKAGHLMPQNILASDKFPELFESAQSIGIECTTDNRLVVEKSRLVFLAVKPDVLRSILGEISSAITSEKIIVSIVSGISIEDIEKLLPPFAHVIRVMPNTPCLVLCGASVQTLGKRATLEDGVLIRTLMQSTGICEEVDEQLMDAVTGLSGSGPAYMYTVLEALTSGAVKMGLRHDLALRLAAQTMMGSAKMILDTGIHPAVLKDAVCSPGGTTIAGLSALEERNIRAALMAAVEASANRSKQLASRPE